MNKDLEGGFVYAGVPAKKICTFEEFVSKRLNQNEYPDGLKRKGDSIDQETADCLWSAFFNKR